MWRPCPVGRSPTSPRGEGPAETQAERPQPIKPGWGLSLFCTTPLHEPLHKARRLSLRRDLLLLLHVRPERARRRPDACRARVRMVGREVDLDAVSQEGRCVGGATPSWWSQNAMLCLTLCSLIVGTPAVAHVRPEPGQPYSAPIRGNGASLGSRASTDTCSATSWVGACRARKRERPRVALIRWACPST